MPKYLKENSLTQTVGLSFWHFNAFLNNLLVTAFVVGHDHMTLEKKFHN